MAPAAMMRRLGRLAARCPTRRHPAGFGLFGAAAALAAASPIASVAVIVFCLALYVRPEGRPPFRMTQRGLQPKSANR